MEKIFLNYDERIVFFSSEKGCVLLELNAGSRELKCEVLNLWNETIKSEINVNYIYLNNAPVNAKKENLKRKDNFYLNCKIDEGYYYKTIKKLYINIDYESISVEETSETQKEYNRGEFHIDKNYIIKGLRTNFNHYKHFFITEEEEKNKDFRTYEREHIEPITKNIELIKNKIRFSKGKKEQLIEKWQNKINEGYFATKYIPTEEENNILYYSAFNRIEKTQERELFLKNYHYLKDNYKLDVYGETYGNALLFKHLKIDLYKIDIEEYIKELGGKA